MRDGPTMNRAGFTRSNPRSLRSSKDLKSPIPGKSELLVRMRAAGIPRRLNRSHRTLGLTRLELFQTPLFQTSQLMLTPRDSQPNDLHRCSSGRTFPVVASDDGAIRDYREAPTR